MKCGKDSLLLTVVVYYHVLYIVYGQVVSMLYFMVLQGHCIPVWVL